MPAQGAKRKDPIARIRSPMIRSPVIRSQVGASRQQMGRFSWSSKELP